MGAYENPITVIDTQSGKIWNDMIANIGKTASAIIDKETARKSALVKKQEKIDAAQWKNLIENREEGLSDISKSGVSDPAYFNYAMMEIDKISEYETLAEYSTAREDRQFYLDEYTKAKQNLSGFIAGGTQMQEAIGDYSKKMGFGENPEFPQPGQPGGLPLVGQDGRVQRYHKVMKTLSKLEKSDITSMYMKNGLMYMDVKGGVWGNKPTTINVTEEINFDPGVIVDDKKLSEEALNRAGLYNDDGTYKKKFMGSPIYMYDTEDGKEGPDATFRYKVTPVNATQVIGIASESLNAVAESIVGDPTNYANANAWWLENGGNDAVDLKYEMNSSGHRVVSLEDQIKFKQAWYEKNKGLLRNYEMSDEKETINVGAESRITSGKDYNPDDTKKPTSTEVKEKRTGDKADDYVNTLLNNPEQAFNEFAYSDSKFKFGKGGFKGTGSNKFFQETVTYTDGSQGKAIQYDLSKKGDIIKFFRRRLQDKKITKTEFDAIQRKIKELDLDANSSSSGVDFLSNFKD